MERMQEVLSKLKKNSYQRKRARGLGKGSSMAKARELKKR